MHPQAAKNQSYLHFANPTIFHMTILLLFIVCLCTTACTNHEEIAENYEETEARNRLAVETMKLHGIEGQLASWECKDHPNQLDIWCWDESKQRYIKLVDEKHSKCMTIPSVPT